MTKEEAIEEINKVFEPAFANYIITALTEGATASDKALEQEPCEDCVSREAVINILPTFGRPTKKFDYILSVLHDIRALPPVTPKPRTGKWIETDEWNDTVNGFEQWGYFHKCSNCGYVFKFLEIDNFCPNCGTDMRGEQK